MGLTLDGTNGISPANWTTATRPASPVAGQQGYNTTTNCFEIWSGLAWVNVTTQTYTVNLLLVAGGGGGGGDDTPSSIGRGGGNGGSGVVILRYFGPQRASGGTITFSGGYTIHTFNSSGTFVA